MVQRCVRSGIASLDLAAKVTTQAGPEHLIFKVACEIKRFNLQRNSLLARS